MTSNAHDFPQPGQASGVNGMRHRQWLRLILRVAGTILTHLFDSALLGVAGRAEPRAGGPVLLLVRLDRIGDMVVWLPAAQALVGTWRRLGFRAVAVVRPEGAPLIGNLPGVERVLTVESGRFRADPFYRARTLLEVRRCGAEVAVEPTLARVPVLGDALVRFSGAARRIGWQGEHSRANRLEMRFGDRAYTELVPAPFGEVGTVRANEMFLDGIGVAAERLDRVPLPRRPLPAPELPTVRLKARDRHGRTFRA